MIIQIAVGVCIGIVAAAFVLKNWSALLKAIGTVSGWVIIFAILGIVVWAAWTIWAYLPRYKIIGYVFGILLVCVLYGLPFFLYGKATQKYPAFGALIYGTSPWNQHRKIPLRLLVMIPFALTVAAIGIGGMLIVVWFLGYVGILA